MTRRILWLIVLIAIGCEVSSAQYVTLTGALQASNGAPANNFVITFQPSQLGFVAGVGTVLQQITQCATSTGGLVVGVPDPSNPAITSVGFSGTLPPATYFIEYAWYDSAGNITLVSAEQQRQLTSTGQLLISPPSSGSASGAVGMKVYIGASSGSETLQGTTTGTATFVQSTPLTSGAAPPVTNATQCKQIANDAIWPVGTGYNVTLIDSNGFAQPSYPMMWQLLGPNSTINLSNGLPYYNGLVTFPTPLLAVPINHATQSISGPLNLTNYPLVNVSQLGVGTSLPGFPIDVENGFINSNLGYLIGGNAGSTGQVLTSGGAGGPDSWTTITAPTVYYQTMAANGTGQTQRPVLNFSSRFGLSDSGSPAETNVDLAASGVGAGSYTCTNLTVNSFGLLTAASNGSCGGVWQFASNTTGCTTGGSSYDVCTMPVTWPTAFADTTYQVSCTPIGPTDTSNPTSGRATLNGITSKTTTGVVYQVSTQGSSAISYTGMDCFGHHN